MENNVQEQERLEIENEAVVKPKYTFRKLRATDIGLMTAIIKKIGINKVAECFKNDEVRKAISNKDNNDNLFMSVGITIVSELVQIVVGAYSDCEKEIHKLLSDTSDLTLEEVQNLELDEFFDMLFDFFKKEELVGFLKHVLKLLGMED